MASRVTVDLVVTRRWFFWPALLAVCALGRIGVLKDRAAAGKWLADHAMRIEVR